MADVFANGDEAPDLSRPTPGRPASRCSPVPRQVDWYTPFWGDADRLANGNILVTVGVRSATLSTRPFERTRTGQVVWEPTFPPNSGSCQADRLSPPPLVEPMP